jgi:hypothetical protein
MFRLRTTLPLAALALTAACGSGPTVVAGETPAVTAAAGATYPIVLPGDTVTVEGRGFGGEQSSSVIALAQPNGPVPLSPVSWLDNAIVAVIPDDAESGRIVIVLGASDTLAPLPFTIRHASAIAPSSFTWQAGPALPVALRAPQLVAFSYPSDTGLSARLLLTGGVNDNAVQVSSFLSDEATAGAPSTWTASDAPIPVARLYAGAATATQGTARLRRHPNRDSTVEGVSYLLGGMDSDGRVGSDVYGISLWQNGDQGAWTKLVPLPDARAGMAVTVAYGNLFVAGGFGQDSIALRSVNVAVVDSFGQPTGWYEGPPLPEGRAFAAAVIHDHVLYVIGGEAGQVDPANPDTTMVHADVYAIHLSERTGFFADAAWQTLATGLLAPRSRHAAFALDNGILVSVGITAGGGGESEFAAFGTDGTLAPFVAVAGTTIGQVIEPGWAQYIDHDGALHVVLAGGQKSGQGPVTQVWWH